MSASGGASRKGEGAGRRLAHKGTSRRHPGGKRTGGGCARRSNATDVRPRIDLISPHSSCPHPSRRMDRSSRPDWSRARCAHPSTRRLVYPRRSFKNGGSRRAPESRAHTIRELVGDESAIQSPRPMLKVAFSCVADPEAPLAVARAPRFDAVFDPWRRSKKASRREADEEYIRLWMSMEPSHGPVTEIASPEIRSWKYL